MPFGVEQRWGLDLVRGQSMQPTIRGWRRIVIVRYGAAPQVGDVVVVDRPDRPGFKVIKRLTAHDSRGWWVESDAHEDGTVLADSWQFGHVSDEQILGVVRWPRLSRRPS